MEYGNMCVDFVRISRRLLSNGFHFLTVGCTCFTCAVIVYFAVAGLFPPSRSAFAFCV